MVSRRTAPTPLPFWPTCARRETCSRSSYAPFPLRTRTAPPRGGAIRHQIAHLTWTERTVLTALEEPEVFARLRKRFAAEADVVDRAAEEGAARPRAEIFASWQDSWRRALG